MCAVQACADLNADQVNRASLTTGKWPAVTPAPSVRVPHPVCTGMKMKRPGRAATGAYSEWVLLSAIRSNANSMAANCTEGCALDHTAMPLCVCAVIQITTNRA